MKAAITVVVTVCLVPVLGLEALLVAATGAMTDALSPSPATAVAMAQIPSAMLDVYAGAAAACPGLPWQLLAAIGTTEDPRLGAQLDTATGEVHPPIVGPTLDGQAGQPAVPDPTQPTGWTRAEGPFGILTTVWRTFGTVATGDGHRVPDYQSAWDGAYTLAHALCEDLGSTSGDVEIALARYDADPAFDQAVLTLALAYGMGASTAPGTTPSGGTGGVPPPGPTAQGQVGAVVAAAESQLGVPYVWGGETPGRGFDCSGLMQWSYAQAGISIPRTTYEQADVGVEVPQPWPSTVKAGDLLLMAGDETGQTVPLGHVGMAVGTGLMIQAPYTGTVVQIDPVPWSSIELVRRIIA